jgi:hypothetical protein
LLYVSISEENKINGIIASHLVYKINIFDVIKITTIIARAGYKYCKQACISWPGRQNLFSFKGLGFRD